MPKTYDLNRLKITGKLNEMTPLCVIIEIADCFGLEISKENLKSETYINNIITTLSECGVKVIENDFTAPDIHGFNEVDLPKIGKFLNGSKLKWKIRYLIYAFRDLIQFYETEIPPLPSGDFNVGQKTPNTPNSYNSTMLYRLCVYYGIKITRKTTIFQMGQAIKFFIEPIEPFKEQLLAVIHVLPRVDIVNLMMSNDLGISPPIPSPRNAVSQAKIKNTQINAEHFSSINVGNEITEEILKNTYSKITDYNLMLRKTIPESHNESIILSALIYFINLTECKNPYKQYIAMKDISINANCDNRYIPIDDNLFRLRYLTNPSWFDIRITWSAKLSSIYSKENIKNFAIAEGYLEELNSGMTPEEAMSLSRCVPTFYLGEHPDNKKKSTNIELDSRDEVNRKILISYGIAETKTFSLYKISELKDCFLDSNSYSNPENRSEQFSKNSILKLRNIALQILGKKVKEKKATLTLPSELTRRNFSTRTFFEETFRIQPPTEPIESAQRILTEIQLMYDDLLKVMDGIDLFNKNNSIEARVFASIYKKGSPEIKNSIKKYLRLLIEMAYYMRGWKVISDEIPLINTTYPLEKQVLVELNSGNALEEFKNFVENMDLSIRDIFIKLPLMISQVSGEVIKFEKNTRKEEGLTILDRINIVRDKSGTSIYSCIRMSSNRFLTSGHYYSVICGLEAPFNIKNMREIT